LYFRTLQHYQVLTKPWLPDQNGYITLLDWHRIGEEEMTEEDKQAWGPGGGGYGVYLVK
jgi:hypothetical protein